MSLLYYISRERGMQWDLFNAPYYQGVVNNLVHSDLNELPFSRGSAMSVSLFFLFGVSAKHLRDEVSTTVSQKDTTGSATLMSISEYNFRKSCITQSWKIKYLFVISLFYETAKVTFWTIESLYSNHKFYRATMAELAAHSLHDRKVVGSNSCWVQFWSAWKDIV